MGRLVRDPDIRNGNNMTVAKFTLAVDRRFKKEGAPTADFINFVAFGKTGEFVEKYLHKGTKVVASGELQNNNWTDKDGNKRYDMQIVVSSVEFAESKKAADSNNSNGDAPAVNKSEGDDFMTVDNDSDDDVPF